MVIFPKDYPDKLRLTRYFDSETNKDLTFLSNNFTIPALTVAQLYKCRWQIELFFKWIKQHLRIKAFYGTSKNAVKTQIWIAISIYVLVAIIKKRLNLNVSLYTILQIFYVANHLILEDVDGILCIHLDKFVSKFGRLLNCHFENVRHRFY